MKKARINFKFRKKLNSILSGAHHNYCYQCSACVASCPAARYSAEFNPRLILLRALYGLEESLIGKDSPIWLCTNCYSCYERCPQDVRPVEVIVALKNLATEENTLPEEVAKFADTVVKTGRSTGVTHSINDRRKRLGLDELKDIPIEEIEKIL